MPSDVARKCQTRSTAVRRPLFNRVSSIACLSATTFLCAQAWAQISTGAKPPATLPAARKSPLAFVPNRGQHPAPELYAASGAGYQIGLEKNRLVVKLPVNEPLPKRGERPSVPSLRSAPSFSIDLLGANSEARIAASQPLLQKNSFIPTGDPKSWITGVPSYARVDYADIYKGVNLDFYGREGRLEYDFTLAPGADARAIRMGLDGVGLAEIDKQGDLLLAVDKDKAGQQLRLLKPVAYQLSADGKQKTSVDAKYRIARSQDGAETVAFSLGTYDHARPLVIDPVLAYGEFLGSSADYLGAITVDTQGDVYTTGYVSPGFYIQKLDPNGNSLLNATLGTSIIYPNSIAIDSSGDVFVTGTAYTGLPTTASAYQQTSPSGSYAPFLAVLKADGSGLSYSTYFGGSSGDDTAYGVAVDSNGKAYITGYAYSTNFPTTKGAYEAAPSSGETFGFVAKIDPTLSGSASLAYSTALVSPGADEYAIAVDGSGNAYVTGYAYPGFPVTAGAYTYSGQYDTSYQAYVTKVNPTGTGLVYSADLGPGQANAIALDSSGTAYVTGLVSGDDFPTTAGAYQSTYAGGFAANLSADGSALLYSTFLNGPSGYSGSPGIFDPTSVAITPGCASSCAAYIAGFTRETDLPLVNPIQSFGNSNGAAFLTELAGNGSSAVLSTYLSGVNAEVLPFGYDGYGATPDVGVDSSGNAYVGLNVSGSDLPTTAALSSSSSTAYVAKIAPTNASLALAIPKSVNFGQQFVNVPTSLYGTAQSVELRNLGSKAINLQTPFTISSSQFSETDTCVSPLPAGGYCTINLSLTATSSGTQTGTLTITSDAPNSPTTVSLSGTAVDTSFLTVSPTSLSFGDQVVGTPSATRTVTITNIGDQPATDLQGYIGPGYTIDYIVVNSCPASLPAGQSCQAGVTFSPSQVGLRSGTIYAGYSPNVGYSTVSVTGTGVPVSGGAGSGTIALSATALNFGTQLQGTTSSSQLVYVYNTGTVPVTITSAVAATNGQTGSSDFQLTNGSYCYAGGYVPAQVGPGGYCYFYITFTPSTSSSETGTLTITDSTSGSPHTVALSGVGVATAQTLVTSPSNLVFPNQPVGITSASQIIYIYNTGTAPFVVDRVEITGDFQTTSDSCAEATLNPTNPQNNYAYNVCYVYITFTPTATGSRTGTLSLIDAATGNPQVVNLMGTGITATGSLVPEPDNLTFEAQATGTTSASQYIYLYNSGNIPVQINSLTTTGDFAIQSNYGCNGTLPTTVSPGSDCSLYVTFTPMQTSGAETGSVVIGSTAGNITIPLSGTAEAATQAIGFTPTTFNFGTVLKGTTAGYGEGYGSGEYRVIVRNTGTEAVTLSSAPTITGSNAADFAFVNTQCGAQLAAGASCSYYLDFTPSTTAAETATFTLTDSAGTQTMTLTGTGASAQLSLYPATLPFDLQLVGTNSSTNYNYYVYFVNNGASALTVQSATITAGGSDFSIPAGYNECSDTPVGTGSYCYVYLDFAPSVAGYRTGTLTFTDQNNNSYTVALAGYAPAGVNSATLDPQALEFQPQPIGATSSNGEQSYQSITLTNTGNTNLTVGTLTGVDTIVGTTAAGDFSTTIGGDECSRQPLPPGSPCTVYVSFVPTTAGSKSGSITFPVTYFDGTTGSFTATLSGQAVSEQDSATLSPTSIPFPEQVAAYPNVNGVSNGFTLTLSNTGNLAFTVGTLTGTDTIVGTSAAGDFVAKNTTLFGVSVPGYDLCSGQPVPAKSSCPVYVYFAPGTTGSKTGSITFPVTYTDGTKGSFTATLSGTSIAAVNTVSISPSATQFESQIVGTTDSGNTQTITVQNTGNIPVTFTASTVSSTNFSISTDCCGNYKTVAPNSSCQCYWFSSRLRPRPRRVR